MGLLPHQEQSTPKSYPILLIPPGLPLTPLPLPSQIWSYPPSSVLGPTLLAIPIEEVFFFFIQTYITSNIYHLCSRPVVHALVLPRSGADARRASAVAWVGVAGWVGVGAVAVGALTRGAGEWTYLALIVGWVAPFLALLW